MSFVQILHNILLLIGWSCCVCIFLNMYFSSFYLFLIPRLCIPPHPWPLLQCLYCKKLLICAFILYNNLYGYKTGFLKMSIINIRPPVFIWTVKSKKLGNQICYTEKTNYTAVKMKQWSKGLTLRIRAQVTNSRDKAAPRKKVIHLTHPYVIKN